jgi:hypothetical protein
MLFHKLCKNWGRETLQLSPNVTGCSSANCESCCMWLVAENQNLRGKTVKPCDRTAATLPPRPSTCRDSQPIAASPSAAREDARSDCITSLTLLYRSSTLFSTLSPCRNSNVPRRPADCRSRGTESAGVPYKRSRWNTCRYGTNSIGSESSAITMVAI